MTEKRTIALCLPDESNDYQKLISQDAKAAAERAGFELDVYFAEGRITNQVRQVYNCIHGEAASRTCAIIAMPVRDNALNRVAHDAAQAGLGWMCVNRRMDCLGDLRKQFPDLPLGAVAPDQREIGRIQGRQFRALLPVGGRVLYVQGNASTSSARERLEGMRETIKGSAVEAGDVVDGNWSTADAERMVSGWLRMVMSGRSRLDLIGCQNDLMAVGARNALLSVAEYLRRPELAKVPLTGCDGLESLGRKMVDEGQLAATIIVPSTGGPAVDAIATAFTKGVLPPEQITLKTASYPSQVLLATGIGKA